MGGSCLAPHQPCNPNAEKPKNLDAESAEDGGPDYQEDDPMDLPAVDADLDKQVEELRALHSEVQHKEHSLPTGREIDKFRKPNGAFRLVSTPPWTNRPPFVQLLVWLSIGRTLQTLEWECGPRRTLRGLGWDAECRN